MKSLGVFWKFFLLPSLSLSLSLSSLSLSLSPSLGIVFVEAIDSTDLQQQDSSLQQLLKQQPLPTPTSTRVAAAIKIQQWYRKCLLTRWMRVEGSNSPEDAADYQLALRLQEEARLLQEESDFQVCMCSCCSPS